MSQQQVVENFNRLKKALDALGVMVKKPMDVDRSNIDATIQRFEFSVELFWKALKYLLAEKGTEVRYPRDVLQEAYAGKLIDQESRWLAMLKDRNLTSHTYNEELADDIYAHIVNDYYPLLRQTFDQLYSIFK